MGRGVGGWYMYPRCAPSRKLGMKAPYKLFQPVLNPSLRSRNKLRAAVITTSLSRHNLPPCCARLRAQARDYVLTQHAS